MMSIYLTPGDVHFDKLVRGASAGLSHCQAMIFPFVNDKYLGIDTLGLCKYPLSPGTFAH